MEMGFLRSMRTTVGVLHVGMATKSFAPNLLKTKNSYHPMCFGRLSFWAKTGA